MQQQTIIVNEAPNPVEGARRVDRPAWLLLAGLLFLRFPLLAGVELFRQGPLPWVDPVYQVGTYILTAGFIWWARDRLHLYHVDKLAIVMVLLFKPLQTILLALQGSYHYSALAFPHWPSLLIWAVAGSLFLSLRPCWSSLPGLTARSVGWLAVGGGAGIAMAIVLGYPMSFQVTPSPDSRNRGMLGAVLSCGPLVAYQVGYAAVTEEPLFRGFLWGQLRMLGWKDVWIWLLQAGLFSLAHIYYLHGYPVSLWLIVPADALVLGALAWRSRTIAASMAAHGFMNALGYTMGLVFLNYRT
jgi:membrane protease YdiL (CAAX protease family)